MVYRTNFEHGNIFFIFMFILNFKTQFLRNNSNPCAERAMVKTLKFEINALYLYLSIIRACVQIRSPQVNRQQTVCFWSVRNFIFWTLMQPVRCHWIWVQSRLDFLVRLTPCKELTLLETLCIMSKEDRLDVRAADSNVILTTVLHVRFFNAMLAHGLNACRSGCKWELSWKPKG